MTPLILIVEDCLNTARLIQTFLSRIGFESEHVTTAARALERTKEEPYYLAVIMDLRLEGMSGLEAVRHLRERERREGLRHLPVVGISGVSSDIQARPCFEAGMDIYLEKPSSLEMIQRTLSGLISGRLLAA